LNLGCKEEDDDDHGCGRSDDDDDKGESRRSAPTTTVNSSAGNGGSGFGRIVLDEAHQIRNRATKTFKSVVALSDCCDAANTAAASSVSRGEKQKKTTTTVRWALTGTVLQNSPDDCFAVLDEWSLLLLLLSGGSGTGQRPFLSSHLVACLLTL
jgi:hypothetical protein